MKLKFHVQTSGETLTAQQPQNNVVRVAIQTLAAVLGGAQSIHTNSKDEALGLPTEEAVTLALRTQQIIAEESGVTRTVDPAGGSHYIERLTADFEARAMEEFEKIERMGGALKAIKSGYIQGEIQRSAYEFQKSLDEKRTIIVGVNKYTEEKKEKIEPFSVSKASEKYQIASLRKLRARRSKNEVEKKLWRLEEESLKSSSERGNLVNFILDAVKVGVTTGEVSNTLRASYGEYHPLLVI